MPMRTLRCSRGLLLVLALLTFGACDDDEEEEGAGGGEATSGEGSGAEGTTPAAADGPLLNVTETLSADDPSDGRGRYDRHFVPVAAGDRVVVDLRSAAFDPIVEATPPGSGALVNDDWNGDRTHSRIELIAAQAGSMKVEVRAYAGAGEGEYTLTVERIAAGDSGTAQGSEPGLTVLEVGANERGEITESDHALSGEDHFDSFVVSATGPVQVAVAGDGGASPRSTLVGPDGIALTDNQGRYEGPVAGQYRLQVIGAPGTAYRVSVTQSAGGGFGPLFARAHHQFNELLRNLGGGQNGGAAPTGGATPTTPTPTTGGGQPPAGNTAAPRALPVRLGDRLSGNLGEADARLPSGEFYDVYELNVASGSESVIIDLESSGFDPFLRVEGPGGQHWENDDHGGTLNSRVELPAGATGAFRIVATSYRPGETGPYELKVLSSRDAQATGGPAPAGGGAVAVGTPNGGPEETIAGELREGDSQLQSGEFMDEHVFQWPAGARIHVEARSTEFDTYLIVHPPSGPQRDNDDMTPGQGLNAGLDLQVSEAGSYRVVVTSYQPGMTGHYQLVTQGASGGAAPSGGTAPPSGGTAPSPPVAGARTESGTLAQGDATLSSGEFVDTFPMTFTAQSAVSIRLDSSDFDTYLIVRAPSGNQEDNDDREGGQLNSGLDIAVAEPGNYQVMVTSYRPGETGSYTLTVTEGESVVSPPSPPSGGGGTAPPAGSGGRVWGLFAGITDYPGSTNDLPECANDARKLAEAVRGQGNMPPDQEFLLTDSQVTTGAIRQAMQTVASRIQPNDVFVFFYSGHGGQTDSSTDARELDQRDEYLFVYDGQLMDGELGTLFDQIHARISLVAIDACFAGGFAKDVITQPGRVGLFSSEEDVTSAVAGRFQAGGYLSHFLRLGIGGAADNDPHNSILTVGELTHYTWRQFGQHASDVRMTMGYQHLVVDRGAVHTTEVLWAMRR